MTDQLIDFNNSNGTDVSQVGKVVINAVLNQSLIMRHRQNLATGDTDFLGGSNEKNFSIYGGELCFSFNEICAPTPKNGEYIPQVLSTFNGFSKETYEEGTEMEDLLQMEGIALGSGATFDERSINPSIDLALTVGGLRSICNNGPEFVKNGDWLMWKAPAKGDIKDRSRKGSERVLAGIEVYNASKHKVTIKAIHEAGLMLDDDENLKPQHRAAKKFIKYFNELIRLGLGNLDQPGSDGYEALNQLLTAIDDFNRRIKRRIFAKALCPSKPGARLDIMLGHYEF